MTLKAAIFDWDGTITDSNNIKTEAFVELFQSACPQAAGYIREYQQNRGGISRFEKFRHYIRHFFHREASAAELEDFGRRYAALCRPKLLNAPFIPGAVETLRKLSLEKIPVFIVTGSPATEIRELAATRNLLPLIHHIYGSPPTKDVLLAVLLAENRLVPEETVFFAMLRQTAKPPESTKSLLLAFAPTEKHPLFRRIRPSSQPLILTFDFTNRHRLAKKFFPDKNTGKKQKILHPNTLICIKNYLFIAIRLKFY